MKNQNEGLEIIVPVMLDIDWLDKDSIVEEILGRYNEYGIKSFCLAAPSKGHRYTGYPSKERYREFAELFKSVKEALSGYDIELGWWIHLTIKNGADFTKILKDDGSEHGFACCPLDPKFIERFSQDVAMIGEIAKPSFIFTEDDYSIRAADGCYCKHHLDEFEKRMGRRYTREEILKECPKKTDEAIELTKAYRKLNCDALVGLAAAARKALDVKSPEIPMGYMQSGNADCDGDVTEAVARALAGKNHTPFVRFHGTGYGFFESKEIPSIVYSPLYFKQHIKGDFKFLHESDTYPHTRYFRSAKQHKSLMSAVCSFGYDGSVLQTNQMLDYANEEPAYAKMIKKEYLRFNAASRIAKQCEIKGVELDYDPFDNTYYHFNGCVYPFWAKYIGGFGIPYTTNDSGVAFLDNVQAKLADEETVLKHLKKTLFLDAVAAKTLCDRGFSKYLGVEIGAPYLDKEPKMVYDLDAKEVLTEKFSYMSKGKYMPSPHMYTPDGKGVGYEVNIIDETCEVITELYTYDKKLVSPAMTRFKNSLGGTVIVYSTSIGYKNKSHSVINYRRQNILQHLIKEGLDDFVLVNNEPIVFVIQNEAINACESGFKAMVTLINLSEDDIETLSLHLPEKLKGKELLSLDIDGEWKPVDYTKTDDGIILNGGINSLDPLYIMFK